MTVTLTNRMADSNVNTNKEQRSNNRICQQNDRLTFAYIGKCSEIDDFGDDVVGRKIFRFSDVLSGAAAAAALPPIEAAFGSFLMERNPDQAAIGTTSEDVTDHLLVDKK